MTNTRFQLAANSGRGSGWALGAAEGDRATFSGVSELCVSCGYLGEGEGKCLQMGGGDHM